MQTAVHSGFVHTSHRCSCTRIAIHAPARSAHMPQTKADAGVLLFCTIMAHLFTDYQQVDDCLIDCLAMQCRSAQHREHVHQLPPLPHPLYISPGCPGGPCPPHHQLLLGCAHLCPCQPYQDRWQRVLQAGQVTQPTCARHSSSCSISKLTSHLCLPAFPSTSSHTGTHLDAEAQRYKCLKQVPLMFSVLDLR